MRNKKISTFEELVHLLTESEYHEDGHLHVGCCQGGNAPMVYSQVSAVASGYYAMVLIFEERMSKMQD